MALSRPDTEFALLEGDLCKLVGQPCCTTATGMPFTIPTINPCPPGSTWIPWTGTPPPWTGTFPTFKTRRIPTLTYPPFSTPTFKTMSYPTWSPTFKTWSPPSLPTRYPTWSPTFKTFSYPTRTYPPYTGTFPSFKTQTFNPFSQSFPTFRTQSFSYPTLPSWSPSWGPWTPTINPLCISSTPNGPTQWTPPPTPPRTTPSCCSDTCTIID